MALQYRCFLRSKGAADLDRCEDACEAKAEAGRFAVADGATESAFTDIWARLLVERFVASDDADLDPWDPSWISSVRQSWLDNVRERLAEEFGQSELPWYVEDGMRRGALATFLGLVVAQSKIGNGYRWRASALGDTCLFHTRGGELLHHFPIERSNQFDSTPRLLASCSNSTEPAGLTVEESAEPNDRLWIATDAMAEWCLKEEEACRSPWQQLEWLLGTEGTDEQFGFWIEGLRTTKRLRNDDVTLLIITL